MKAKLVAQPDIEFEAWKERTSVEQFEDGFRKPADQ
jgi:hypothetical protein